MIFFVECLYFIYKDFIGYVKFCIVCFVNLCYSRIGSSSRVDCYCIEGYEGNLVGYVECKSKYNYI